MLHSMVSGANGANVIPIWQSPLLIGPLGGAGTFLAFATLWLRSAGARHRTHNGKPSAHACEYAEMRIEKKDEAAEGFSKAYVAI